MESIKRKLQFNYCFSVDRSGTNGGLALLWNQNLDLSVSSYSHWHISAQIKGLYSHDQCLFIGFYGHPETAKRAGNWSLLSRLQLNNNRDWFCFGDFNVPK